MAASNVLEAKITGDISDLQAKLSKADELVNNYSKRWTNANTGLKNANKASLDAERAMSKLNKELESGTISLSQYDDAMEKTGREYATAQQQTRKYQRQLSRLDRELKDAENATENYNAELASTPRAAQQAAQANQRLGTSTQKMGTAVKGNAVPAMTSFSQVIQDAPYGIQGVANNIQQLTMQMGYLSTSAGGTKNALKSMLASLAGPTGILLAISALTSVLISYGDEILDFIQNTSDAEKAQRKLNEAMSGAVAEARTQGLEMKTLVGIIQTANGDLVTQQNAYEKLNEVAPELTENYSLQAIAAGKATQAVNEMTEAMLRQARTEAALDVIKETYEELLKLENGLGAATAGIWDYVQAVTAGVVPGRTFGSTLELEGAVTGAKNITDLTEKLERYQDAYRKGVSDEVTSAGDFGIFNNKEAIAAGKAQEELLKKQTETTEKSNTDLLKAQKERAKIRIGGREAEKEMQDLMLQDATDFANQLAATYDINYGSLSNIGNGLADSLPQIERFESLVKEIQKTLGEGFDGSGFDIPELEALQTKLQNTKDVAQIAASSIQSAFGIMAGNLVSSMGEAETGMERFKQAFLSSALKVIGAALSQSIANAILGGTQSGAGTGPLAAFTTPAFIASMVGSVVGAFAAIPSFASGGIVPGGSFNGDKVPAYLNSGEMILNGGQQNQLFKMLDMRMGGVNANHEPIKVQVYGQIRGENIELASDRYNKRRGRIN